MECIVVIPSLGDSPCPSGCFEIENSLLRAADCERPVVAADKLGFHRKHKQEKEWIPVEAVVDLQPHILLGNTRAAFADGNVWLLHPPHRCSMCRATRKSLVEFESGPWQYPASHWQWLPQQCAKDVVPQKSSQWCWARSRIERVQECHGEHEGLCVEQAKGSKSAWWNRRHMVGARANLVHCCKKTRTWQQNPKCQLEFIQQYIGAHEYIDSLIGSHPSNAHTRISWKLHPSPWRLTASKTAPWLPFAGQ